VPEYDPEYNGNLPSLSPDTVRSITRTLNRNGTTPAVTIAKIERGTKQLWAVIDCWTMVMAATDTDVVQALATRQTWSKPSPTDTPLGTTTTPGSDDGFQPDPCFQHDRNRQAKRPPPRAITAAAQHDTDKPTTDQTGHLTNSSKRSQASFNARPSLLIPGYYLHSRQNQQIQLARTRKAGDPRFTGR